MRTPACATSSSSIKLATGPEAKICYFSAFQSADLGSPWVATKGTRTAAVGQGARGAGRVRPTVRRSGPKRYLSGHRGLVLFIEARTRTVCWDHFGACVKLRYRRIFGLLACQCRDRIRATRPRPPETVRRCVGAPVGPVLRGSTLYFGVVWVLQASDRVCCVEPVKPSPSEEGAPTSAAPFARSNTSASAADPVVRSALG